MTLEELEALPPNVFVTMMRLVDATPDTELRAISHFTAQYKSHRWQRIYALVNMYRDLYSLRGDEWSRLYELMCE